MNSILYCFTSQHVLRTQIKSYSVVLKNSFTLTSYKFITDLVFVGGVEWDFTDLGVSLSAFGDISYGQFNAFQQGRF